MREIFLSLVLIISVSNISFGEDFSLKNNYSTCRFEQEKNIITENQIYLTNSYPINSLDVEKINSSANKKSGAFLIYLGMGAAIIGVSFLVYSYSDIAFVDTEKYKKPGLILTSTGLGFMILGYILRKSGSNESSRVILQLNSIKAGASLSINLNF